MTCKTFAIILLSASAVVMTGCASTPNPEKVCTAEWITPRADRAVSRIETRAEKSIKALRKAGEKWAVGDTPNMFQLLALQNSIKSLEKELTQGKGIKDLRTLAKTCDDPQIVTKSVRNLLERQGVPDRFISFVEGSPIYDRILGDVMN